ncbi:MAG: MFS transporter [Rickettsia endosymbiont of Bryobia graminum]|nr:MFS transporter [Rickettsia endosymbiont of Bryobia graminum]
MSKTSLTKQDLSILIGNSLDHFDTAIYGFLAPVIAKIFFPNNDPIVGLILAYSIFASSIFTRPIGSLVFSMIAQKLGATRALSYSLIGVAITTILIGFLPAYKPIGWLSPCILTISRMLQGVFAEGGNTIAKLYIIENKIHIKALKASSIYQMSSMFGIILASFVSMMLINTSFHDYWRLCFIFGGSTGIAGYYLRRYFTKEPIIIRQKITINNTINLVNNNKQKILCVSIVNGFSYMTYAIPFIVMNSFIPLITSISLETMMAYNTLLLIIDAILFVLIYHLIKNYDPTKVMIHSANILLITIIPLWFYFDHSSLWYIVLVCLWIVILGVAFACPINIWVNGLFDDSNKYLLSGIGSSIGSSIIGRFTPAICIALWHFTGISISIAIYIAAVSSITVWALKTANKN